MKTILTAALATSIASAALAQTTTPPTATTPPAQTKPMTPSGATAPAAGAEKPVVRLRSFQLRERPDHTRRRSAIAE